MVIPLALTTIRATTQIDDSVTQKLRTAFERLAGDDITALEDIYDVCANDVYGLALWSTGSPDDAFDIVQEVFLKLARKRKTLAEVQKPKNYILQITQRLGIDFYRTRQRRKKREEPIEFLEPLFLESQASQDDRIQLHNAIAKLHRKQREVLYLRYFLGFSFSEIAEVSDMNLFTAAGRCRLAIQRLRKLLGKKS
jgi:RNA polymerase sigma-70 factor, ECF subfamily